MDTKLATQNRAGRELEDNLAMPERMPRILIAEDDVEMRRLLTWHLHKAGFEVVECTDGWELLDHLGKPVDADEPDDFDLIVSDIRMPGVTGLEILEGIHETEWFVPMILITAFGSAKVHQEAEQYGAAGMFDKPFDINDLIYRIREVLVLDSPLGNNWQLHKTDRRAVQTSPVDVVFDHMEPLAYITDKVRKSAAILNDIQDKVLYCRAVISGPGSNHARRYQVQIMVTLSNKVFVVRSNMKSINSESDLSSAIPKAFEVTLGKIRKYLGNQAN